MNPEQLLQHFDRISEAPDAIPRLRRFILDLAVRGKLVEQDPDDEPAVELLKRIQAEKTRLLNAGGAKKQKSGAQLINDELPFPVPKSWQWSQLATIGFISPRNDADGATLASFVPMTLIPAEYGVPHKHEERSWNEFKTGYTHFAEGDVGLAKITPCFENGKSTVFRGLTGGFGAGTTELHIVRPLLVNADYILLFLKSPYFIETGIPRMTGTAGQKRVSTDYFAYSPFPLPPLAEQHRIVAKVDELMALCDQLLAAQTEREQSRDRLVAASLNKLNQSEQSRRPGMDCRDPDFRDESNAKPTKPAAILAKQPAEIAEAAPGYLPVNWVPAIPAGTTGFDDVYFVLENLPHLTTRPAHIKQLRQTILNLAVRGKLVPQDPNDEPAVVLLKKLLAEKSRMEKEGAFRRQQMLSALSSEEIPFELPALWEWQRLGNIGLTQTGTTPSSNNPEYFGDFIPFVKPANLTGNCIDYSGEGISEEGIQYSRLIPKHSALMVCIGSSIGKVNVTERDVCCNQQINAVTPYIDELTGFTSIALKTTYFQKLVLANAGMGTLPIISKGKWEVLPVPVPPLTEQHRIVAKVDELMALCDQLETQLTRTTTDSRRSLEAVLHEALLPADVAA